MNSAHLIKLYTVYFLLFTAALCALLVLLSYFNVEIGGSLGVITVILPAMLVGQRYAKRWEARPKGGYAWRLTAIFAAISFGAGAVIGAVLLSIAGAWHRIAEVFAGPDGLFMWGILLALYLMSWGLAWFFFGFGAKMQLRSMAEQRAARGQGGPNQP